MDKEEFNNMRIDDKAKLLLSKFQFITKSEFKDLEISIYKPDVAGIHVELWFNPRSGRVTKIQIIEQEPFNHLLKHYIGAPERRN